MAERTLTPGDGCRAAAVTAGHLRARASAARGRAEELQVQTVRCLSRSALLGARLRSPVSGALRTVGGLRDRLRSAEAEAKHLRRALVSNRRIAMAVGILMRGLPASEKQAFEVLRQASMQENIKVRDVAERVIYTGSL